MPPKILVIGVGLALLALVLSSGAAHWLDTRTFQPVNTPIVLEPGRVQTIRFTTNLREEYGVGVMVDYSPDDWAAGKCHSDRLDEMTWKIFRVGAEPDSNKELWASKGTAAQHWESYRLVPGTYELDWSAPPSANCLNSRHPRMEVAAYASEYREAVNAIQCGSVFLGGIGLTIMFLGARWKLASVFAKKPFRIFPEMEIGNVLPLQRYRPMPPFAAPLDFGIAWGSVLMVLVFIFYRGLLTHPPAHGLRIGFSRGNVQAPESPWTDTLGIYVKSKGQFLVNRQPVNRDALPDSLQRELGKRVVWTVYLEADSDTLFGDTVYCIDTIQGLGARVIWITPKMREEWRAAAGGTGPTETSAP